MTLLRAKKGMTAMLSLPVGKYLFSFLIIVFDPSSFFLIFCFVSSRHAGSVSRDVASPAQSSASVEAVDVLSAVMPPPKASSGFVLKRRSAK